MFLEPQLDGCYIEGSHDAPKTPIIVLVLQYRSDASSSEMNFVD
jgi:hypothetical protein